MEKMWAGRFLKNIDEQADDFNSSIHFDCRMYKQDIDGSIAHVTMLGKKRIIPIEDSESIIEELKNIKKDIENGTIKIDLTAEDIHMYIESELTKRLGKVGKKLHTSRSRNDQVALDMRLYLKEETLEIICELKKLITSIVDKAEENKATIMPGYTHLQRAQPITFGHHLMAYSMMFLRDIDRLEDAIKRINISPLGACALAGTTYDIDRDMTAKLLEFDSIALNSLDAVSDRDFCIELCSCFSTIMMHLSRFSEEIIMWASWEFKFIELDDAYTTGSSIMPQKKNPDMAELIRGKTGRVYGSLMTLLTVLKGLPLAYNKDMQEDKEAIFDSLDTVKKCIKVATPMIGTMTVLKDNMYEASQKGFINATDLADYLVKKGMAFRDAYKIIGKIVAECIETNKVLDTLELNIYKSYSELFNEDLYDEISLETCIRKRISKGGTGIKSVEEQIEYVKKFLCI